MARATPGMAGLARADDSSRAARLAREPQALAYQPAAARRERLLLAQARIVDAQALAAMSQAGAARAPISQAVDIIASLQSPDSPRLAGGAQGTRHAVTLTWRGFNAGKTRLFKACAGGGGLECSHQHSHQSRC